MEGTGHVVAIAYATLVKKTRIAAVPRGVEHPTCAAPAHAGSQSCFPFLNVCESYEKIRMAMRSGRVLEAGTSQKRDLSTYSAQHTIQSKTMCPHKGMLVARLSRSCLLFRPDLCACLISIQRYTEVQSSQLMHPLCHSNTRNMSSSGSCQHWARSRLTAACGRPNQTSMQIHCAQRTGQEIRKDRNQSCKSSLESCGWQAARQSRKEEEEEGFHKLNTASEGM